jgi:hypothetical protein
MRKKNCLVIIFILVLIRCAANKKNLLPTQPPEFAFLYIPQWTVFEAPKIATLIKQQKLQKPTIAIIKNCCPVPDGYSLSETTEAINLISEILDRSQVDVVLLTSNIINFLPYFKTGLKKHNFTFLAANLSDSATSHMIWSEYIIYKLDNYKIAILGISYNAFRKNITKRDPNFAILKLLPILKNRADFLCLLTDAQDTLDYPFNIILGAPALMNKKCYSFDSKDVQKIIFSIDQKNAVNLIEAQSLNWAIFFDDPEILRLKEEIARLIYKK